MHHTIVHVARLIICFTLQTETADRRSLLVRVIRLLLASIATTSCHLMLIHSLLSALQVTEKDQLCIHAKEIMTYLWVWSLRGATDALSRRSTLDCI